MSLHSCWRSPLRKAVAIFAAGLIINPAFAAGTPDTVPNTYVDLPVPTLSGWSDVNTFTTIDGFSGATPKTLIYPDAAVKAASGAADGHWDEALSVGAIYWELDNNSGRAPGIQTVTDDFNFPVNNCIMASGEMESTEFPGTVLPKTCNDGEGSSKRYFFEVTKTDVPVDLVFDLGLKDIRYKGIKNPADDGGVELLEFRDTYGIGRIYRVIQKVINNTDKRVASYKFELGQGTGDDFTALTFAEHSVAFEMRPNVPREFFEGDTGAPDISVWDPLRFATFSPKMFDDGARPRFDPGFLDHAAAGFINPADIEAGEKSQYIGTGASNGIPGQGALTDNYFDMKTAQASDAGLIGNLFGYMLPDSMIPTVIGKYSTNEVGGESDSIVAWWDGSNWRSGRAGLDGNPAFGIIPDSQLEQWAAQLIGRNLLPGEDENNLVRYDSLLSDDLSGMNTDLFIYIGDKLIDKSNGELTLDSITLRVTAVSVDAAGLGADTASLEPEWMAPGNEAPALSSYLPADGEPVAINDTATIMATDPVTTANIAVLDNDLRDGTLLDPADVVRVEIEQAPTDGNAVINLDNSITYTPALGFTGTALFEYRVTTLDNNNDEAFSVAAVKVTVEAAPIPDAPQAVSDSANAFEETAVTLDVLTNDSLNNDTATTVLVEIVDDAVNGTAVVNVDNSITYTPNAGFVSTDTITAIERFTYQVTVDGKVSNAALVSVKVQSKPDVPPPTGATGGSSSSSGCSVGNPNGPFDPMLPGLLVLALAGLFLRRRHA